MSRPQVTVDRRVWAELLTCCELGLGAMKHRSNCSDPECLFCKGNTDVADRVQSAIWAAESEIYT